MSPSLSAGTLAKVQGEIQGLQAQIDTAKGQQQTQAAATSQENAPSLQSLVNPDLGSFGSLSKPYGEQFQAPTDITEQNDPGFKARLDLGQKVLERSQAARGGALTAGASKAVNQFAQDYASNEYSKVFDRSLTDYTTKYNAYNNDQTNQFNRLASLLGVGQQSASQLQNAGQNSANNSSQIALNVGSNMAADTNAAGAARASGYQNAGNIWGNAASNVGGNASQLFLLSQLLNQPSGTASGRIGI